MVEGSFCRAIGKVMMDLVMLKAMDKMKWEVEYPLLIVTNISFQDQLKEVEHSG